MALALALVLGSGCREPEPPRLVAQPGCGIEDDLVDILRVKARGDFPEGAGTEVRLAGGEQTLAWGDRPVDGVTVEGLFGGAVEAVGRTARIHAEGAIPVYFDRVDGLCPVPDEAEPREAVAVAVGPEGDVLVVGGRDARGSVRDEVIHLHDESGRTTVLPGQLPTPLVGHTVHSLGDRRFLVLGGVSADRVVQGRGIIVDLDEEDRPIGESMPVSLPGGLGSARAFHAGATDPRGRIVVAGGCQRVTTEFDCRLGTAGGPHGEPNVLGSSAWLDPDDDDLDFQEGPPLVIPRYGATLMFARDGVAYLAGGRDAQGAPVYVVERLRPDTTRFRRYGGDLGPLLEDDVPVVGAALHEGGVVLLALADGRIHWITDYEREEFRPWSGWCEGEGDCFADLELAAPAQQRGMITLPGERLLVDGTVLPVAALGLSGDDGRDLYVAGPGAVAPPPRRVETRPVLLADGTVLLVGGHDPETGELAEPLALRLRPALDGPDEGIPELSRATPGSLVAHDPERAVIEGETVRLLAAEAPDVPFPSVRAHARGFRSASFRFEVTVQVTSGVVVPYLVLQHGGVEGVSVSLESERIQAHLRDPQGRVVDLSCGTRALTFETAQVLRVDVAPDSILLRRGGETIAQCPLSGARPWSVGVGATGSGEMLVYGLRLTRQ